ncbi:MAG: hypothetical protein WCK29_01210, partial [archaeon]
EVLERRLVDHPRAEQAEDQSAQPGGPVRSLHRGPRSVRSAHHRKVSGAQGSTGSVLPSAIPGLSGIALDANRLGKLATAGPRQIYRLESTGTIVRPGNKRVQVRIVAIFDTKHINQNTTSNDINDRQGTWVYWRME